MEDKNKMPFKRENNKCPLCGKEVGQFRDPLSAREYAISGLCQKCQDKIFGK